MRPSREGDHKTIGGKIHLAFAFDKVAVDPGRIALLKAAELSGQHAIEGVGDHSHDHIEVHLGQDG